jgi:hypothetical protein
MKRCICHTELNLKQDSNRALANKIQRIERSLERSLRRSFTAIIRDLDEDFAATAATQGWCPEQQLRRCNFCGLTHQWCDE